MSNFTLIARRTFIACCAGTLFTLGAAHAQPATSSATAASSGVTAPAAPQLTIRDIYDRVEAAGYLEIREIEWDDGRYEVKARNAEGERVKLHVDGSSGAIESVRPRDRRSQQ